MEKKQKITAINPLLSHAYEDLMYSLYVLIGCVSDDDIRDCLSKNTEEIRDIVKGYLRSMSEVK